MFKNEKNKILTCFFQAVFFSRKKNVFFPKKTSLFFSGCNPSHAVTALGVTGRAGSVRVPLAAGEGGVTSRGQAGDYLPPLPACGQAGDYLPPLPACGLRRWDGWPDEKPRRVLGRLPRSILWFLKRRRSSLLLQEGQL